MHYHYVYVYIITHMWHIALIAPPMRGATHAWQDFRWGSGRGGRRTIFDSLTLHLENWSTDYWSLHWCVFPWQCSGGAAEARKDLGMTFWIAHTLGESWRHDLGMTFTSTCRSSEGFIFFAGGAALSNVENTRQVTTERLVLSVEYWPRMSISRLIQWYPLRGELPCSLTR